jgi:hypothetical protein
MIDPEHERQRLAKAYSQMSEGELLKLYRDAGSLTEVGSQVLLSEIERRGLNPSVPDIGIDVAETRELITVHRYRNLPEALIAKSSLESAGIECFLSDENIVRMDWFWSDLLGGVKLLVGPNDADAAHEIIGQSGPEGFQVEGVGEYERPHCPKCNSMDISFEELNKPIAFASAYFGVPIPLHRTGWRCHSCRQRWQDNKND